MGLLPLALVGLVATSGCDLLFSVDEVNLRDADPPGDDAMTGVDATVTP